MNYNSHPKMNYLYIGVDCHKDIHVATLINCFNEKITTITFNNDNKGFKHLVKTVEERKSNLIPIFGLEDVKHLGYELANYLLSKNYIVKHVNSNLTYVERKKNPIIIKNDEIDSQCVAKILLDELDNLPNAQNDEIYWTLKQIEKMRASLVKNNVRFKNKLHCQLMHHYPNYKDMFFNIDCMTALNLWEHYPSPNMILEEEFDTFVANLKKWSRNKLGVYKATELLEVISDDQYNPHKYQEERNILIKTMVRQIKDNNKRLEEVEEELIKLYDSLDCKLHTFPCLDKLTGACMLAQIGNINRFKNSGKLARYAGIAPIEKSSGGTEKALKNEFGNRKLNSMFYNLACRSICAGSSKETPFNPIFNEYYNKKINEGKTKHQALICVMRRTCNIIYGMLNEGKEYQKPKQLDEECRELFRERREIEKEKERKKKEKKEKHKKKIQAEK